MSDVRYKLPIIPLRGVVVFPHTVINFDVGREKSVSAVNAAMAGDREIFLCAQKDPEIDDPVWNDLHVTGTIAKVKQILKPSGDLVRIMAEGIKRGRMINPTDNAHYIEAEIEGYHRSTSGKR